MYCIIGKRDGAAKRGSYIISERFADYFNNIDFIRDTKVKDLNLLYANYSKVIIAYQKCLRYSFGNQIYKLRNKNHLVFTRDVLFAKLFNSASNGFNFYNKMKLHKHFIPFITDVPKTPKREGQILGFYLRQGVVKDSFNFFLQELENLKFPINVVTYGYYYPLDKLKKVISHYHTQELKDFFSRIDFYLYPQSAKVIDPFPHSLLEAIQSSKQIILPRLSNRNHKDGIDDIISCLGENGGYHKNLNDIFLDKRYDNSGCGLRFENFKKFYQCIINEQNFENRLEYGRYKTFYEWCEFQL